MPRAKNEAPWVFSGNNRANQAASFRMTGTTDANHVRTPALHVSHDLGMAMDLGNSDWISPANQLRDGEKHTPLITISAPAPQWSVVRAIELTDLLNAKRTGPANQVTNNNQQGMLRDFLAMYWATKEDIKNENNDWLITNGSNNADKARIQAALFRGANSSRAPDAAKSLIAQIFVGAELTKSAAKGGVVANRYQEVIKVLKALGVEQSGITVGNSNGHQNHFHLTFTPPGIQDIDPPRNLLADEAGFEKPQLLGLEDIQIGQAISQAKALPKANKVVRDCWYYQLPNNEIAPGSRAKEAMDGSGERPDETVQQWGARLDRDWEIAKVSVVQTPLYGTYSKNHDDPIGDVLYNYIPPTKDFSGEDRISFMVEFKNGKRVLMRYQLSPGQYDNDQEVACKKTMLGSWDWISGEEMVASGEHQNLAAWQRSAQLSALLANAQQTLIGFTDLPATALGQTTGEGAFAQITLDQNAAGHGWYIDPTPLDNTDDYLPTSDPTVFKAKPGSAAEGKMDMLSVLLHEYGHALGLEHSADASNYMAASLQPGVRKLPSADELALMARLVAQLKVDEGREALTPTLSQGEREQDNPSSPLSALGLLPLGFIRRKVGLGTSAPATHTDYLTAINPTLTNGNFAAGQSGTVERWETTGKVNIDSATPSTITLGESTLAQAHLAQAFIIAPQDRFLTFTVSGLALQTNSIQQNGILTAAPQDAFEVALTNANTGSNLLAGLATDHSDALLNIQLASSDPASALQERSAAGLRHTDNADGSRTYLLDLSAISLGSGVGNTGANLSNTGVAVNLSFDLIGFGITAAQLGSQVSIKDVRLIKSPVAVDDTATLNEDNSITINAKANDLNADVTTGSSTSAADFTAKIVTTAQHGQVSLNPDGTFGYTPEANFYGTDSFTYQYSNAAGEASNTATVNLTVTPVNDAPVAADVAVTTLEDTLATINLVALDADNTSASLQFTIQTQPTHGTLALNANGSYSYTPAANYNGADSFTYLVTDGSLTSNLATVHISITAVNDAPVLPSSSLSLNEDSPLLINPLAGATDIDGDVLTATIIASPLHGSLSVNPDGTYSYSPAANYYGTDSFTYRVSDGTASSELATVTLSIAAVNDAPVASDVTVTTLEDTLATINLIAADAHNTNAGLVISIQTQPQHGSLQRNLDGSYSRVASAYPLALLNIMSKWNYLGNAHRVVRPGKCYKYSSSYRFM